MYKVLVFGMTNNYGGVEAVVMNYYRRFDHTKIHFDFICNMTDKIAYETELKRKYNCKFFKTVRKRENIIKYYIQLTNIFSKIAKDYDCLWFNVNNLVNIDCLKLAKKYGINHIIIHAHNSKIMEAGIKGKIKERIHKIHSKQIYRYANDFLACSDEAAKWFYQEDSIKYRVINNSIDVSKYQFNLSTRNKIRKKYNIDNNLVIGNVGRLSFQKNQTFLLDIFKIVKKNKQNSKLILVGSGNRDQLIKKAKELNIYNDVIFMGMIKDASKIYNSFDIFAFPSKFEGFGIAAIEAQANGLPVVASKYVIPQNIKVNDNVMFIDLKQKANYWAKQILKLSRNCHRSEENNKMIKNRFVSKKYDIHTSAVDLEKILEDKNI